MCYILEWAYDLILILEKNFMFKRFSEYVFLSTSTRFFSFLTETGLTMLEIIFSITNGLGLVSRFSYKDSKMTKPGKDEGELSL